MSSIEKDCVCENKLCNSLNIKCGISSNSTQGIGSISNNNNNTDDISVCANCGKEGDDVNNICNKCKMVKYCNVACKKKHRHKHKKECEEYLRLAAERAAELHDEKMFKQPPPEFGDCPICFLPLPILSGGRNYYACCGKVICSGCIHAPVYDNQGNKVVKKSCPFCRTPYPTSEEEMVKRYKKRVEMNDRIAISDVGSYYRDGLHGFPQDYTKALELYHHAVELDYSKAYNGIGYAYQYGQGVEVDIKKASHYFELAAMGGDATARYNLGVNEENAGNIERALRHHMIASRSGYAYSLEKIKKIYTNGHATKD